MTEVVDAFRRRYLETGVWTSTTWMGRQVIKSPLDLWIYQEILFETRPDVIVETGTWYGGSAHYLASICDLIQGGRVITIDLKRQEGCPEHPRITYLTGSSVSREVLDRVRGALSSEDRVMVILDSDHSRDHVLAELRAYAPLVSTGCYLIVEDTAATPILTPDVGPGPREAVEQFLHENSLFTIDRQCEKFLMTWQPGGYLRRGSV
jgi:cephalosporin hydroxylase